jgi:hypothetical protein
MGVLRRPGGIRRVVKGGRLVAGAECPRIEELELGYDIAPESATSDATTAAAGDDPDRPCCLKTADELGQ